MKPMPTTLELLKLLWAMYAKQKGLEAEAGVDNIEATERMRKWFRTVFEGKATHEERVARFGADDGPPDNPLVCQRCNDDGWIWLPDVTVGISRLGSHPHRPPVRSSAMVVCSCTQGQLKRRYIKSGKAMSPSTRHEEEI